MPGLFHDDDVLFSELCIPLAFLLALLARLLARLLVNLFFFFELFSRRAAV